MLKIIFWVHRCHNMKQEYFFKRPIESVAIYFNLSHWPNSITNDANRNHHKPTTKSLPKKTRQTMPPYAVYYPSPSTFVLWPTLVIAVVADQVWLLPDHTTKQADIIQPSSHSS